MVIATNMLFFYVLRFVNEGRHFHSVVLNIDKILPFVPGFIYIYFIAFAQWVGCYLVLLIENKKRAVYFMTGASITNLICGIIFIVFPTIMVGRPEVTGGGFTNAFIRFIFSADTPPVNLFPSIHCFESWMCIRLLFASEKLPKWIKYSNVVLSLLVFASVLLVKQHAFIDVPAGILVAELSLLIVRKTKADKKFISLERKIWDVKGE